MSRDHIFAVTIVGMLLLSAILGHIFFFKVPLGAEPGTNFGKEYSMIVTDYANTPVHLYSWRRQPLLVYSWASWCPYCADELKNLARLKSVYGDKITILAINRAEPRVAAQAYSDKLNIAQYLTLLLDPEDRYFKAMGGYAMPELILVNSHGYVTYHQHGPIQPQVVDDEIKQTIAH